MTKRMIFILLALVCATIGTAAFAVSGVGSVAAQVKTNVGDIAKLVTAAAYVAGMAFAITGVVKFKQCKDQPTQHPIGVPIAYMFIGSGLIFAPSVFSVSGYTLFAGSGQVGTVSGITSFTYGK